MIYDHPRDITQLTETQNSTSENCSLILEQILSFTTKPAIWVKVIILPNKIFLLSYTMILLQAIQKKHHANADIIDSSLLIAAWRPKIFFRNMELYAAMEWQNGFKFNFIRKPFTLIGSSAPKSSFDFIS